MLRPRRATQEGKEHNLPREVCDLMDEDPHGDLVHRRSGRTKSAPAHTVPIFIQSTQGLRPIRPAPSVITTVEYVLLIRPSSRADFQARSRCVIAYAESHAACRTCGVRLYVRPAAIAIAADQGARLPGASGLATLMPPEARWRTPPYAP